MQNKREKQFETGPRESPGDNPEGTKRKTNAYFEWVRPAQRLPASDTSQTDEPGAEGKSQTRIPESSGQSGRL